MLHTGGPCDQGLRPEACDLVWIPMYWTPHASRARSAGTEPALPVTRFACSQGEIPVASAHREKGRPPQRSRALPCPAGPNSLPAQTHSPNPSPAAPGAGQTPQARAPDRRKFPVNLKQKQGQRWAWWTPGLCLQPRPGPQSSHVGSAGLSLPTGMHSLRPSCHFSSVRTGETRSMGVGGRNPAQEARTWSSGPATPQLP